MKSSAYFLLWDREGEARGLRTTDTVSSLRRLGKIRRQSIWATLTTALALVQLVGCRPSAQQTNQWPPSGAAVLVWGSFIDSGIDLNTFFAADHTVSLRFMTQYERSYEGPLLANVRSLTDPNYLVEMGTYSDFVGGARYFVVHLLVDVGGNIGRFKIPNPINDPDNYVTLGGAPQKPQPIWRRLLLVRRGGALEVWLDGQHLCMDNSSTCDLAVPANAPRGILRIGKKPIDPASQPETQFYGFIDDVAVFNRALTQSEIVALSSTTGGLTGNESRLLQGIAFDQITSSTPSRLQLPAGFGETATVAAVTSQHSSQADATKLPIVSGAKALTIPFPFNETWEVLQGFNSTGSHAGRAAFAWDLIFVPASHPSGTPQQDGKDGDGTNFLAAVDGTVNSILQSNSTVNDPSNFISVQVDGDQFTSYLHLKQNSAVVSVNDQVARDAVLAKVSNVGGGTPHLHIAVTNLPETKTNLLVTRPAPFADYCASDDFGKTWAFVPMDMPRVGQWIRRADTSKPDGDCSRPR